MSKKTDDSGWQVATALQALPAVMILGLLWFTPNSPRWLVFNDRSDEALQVLRSVRRKEDVDIGQPELEIAAMREEGQIGKREKGPWKDLFNAKNRRRTGYVQQLCQKRFDDMLMRGQHRLHYHDFPTAHWRYFQLLLWAHLLSIRRPGRQGVCLRCKSLLSP